MAKKNDPYFECFMQMVDHSCRAAEHLQHSLTNFNSETLSDQIKTMHDIEHSADMLKHDIIKRLVKEFIPPIDREDIIQMTNELDDVTDKIEDILIRMYMYRIKKIPAAALEFSDVIMRCCKLLQSAMVEFPNFQKSTVLKQAIIDVNTIEEVGDKLYIEAIHDLYKQCDDPITIIAWSELFERLEECCDACENVADIMEIIVMKNS